MTELFNKLKIGDLEINNRMVLAPMTRARAGESRVANDLMAEYYAQRADTGLIISEASSISEQALGWNNSPGIYTDEHVKGWEKVTKAIHEKDGKIFLQLWHYGRASHTSFHPELGLAVAPSAIKINEEYIHTPEGKQAHETPRALEIDEIKTTIEDYKNAAKRAKEAGFDGVEIHGANGYLIDTFLQSYTNKREDEYGGSIENRSRFLFEVVEAVTEVWDSSRVGVRISPNGAFNDMGSKDFREQFLYIAKELNKYNLAYLHVMDGLGFGFHELGEPMILSEFKEVYNGLIIGNVGYTKDSAEETIKAGNADMIAFGRPFISNPDLVYRFKNNLELNVDAEISDWYSDIGARGYTDFPVYGESLVKK
ncbi:MAG: alkene reductase [Candidatus Caenarcaniphilales bacterium]|nr:alkene reductase [Candidatus Caenarcaniphilales bacterium]